MFKQCQALIALVQSSQITNGAKMETSKMLAGPLKTSQKLFTLRQSLMEISQISLVRPLV